MKLRNLFTWLVAIAILGTTPLTAQHGQRVRQLPETLDFKVTAPSGVPEIPFQLVNNHIIIPISVNGSEPFKIILDTGMPMTGLALFDSDKVKALDLSFEPGMRVQVGGAGGKGKHFEAKMASDVAWSMPGLETTGGRAIILPAMEHLTHYHGGIIGAALFENFAVEIDHDDNVIRLHDPNRYQAPPESTSAPLTFKMGIPFVDASAKMVSGSNVPITVAVDLGASHAISLNTDSHEEINVPEGAVKTILGRGLSGPVRGKVGRIAGLDLGGYDLRNVITGFPVSKHQDPRGIDSRNGNLGNGILKRFNVTFDYQRKQMVLEPNKRFGDPFEFDMSGIVFQQSHQRGVWIESILPDSPAEEAGLRPDDIILSVDGIDAAAVGYYAIREKLREDGKSVTILYRRGNKEREVKLKLRRLV